MPQALPSPAHPPGSISMAPPLTVSPLIFTAVGDLTVDVGRRGRVAALDHVLPWYWSSFFSFWILVCGSGFALTGCSCLDWSFRLVRDVVEFHDR
jgi:hypothetical protein